MLATMLLCRGEKKQTGGNSPRPGCLYLTSVVFALGGVIFYLVWPYLNQDSGAIAERLVNYGITRSVWPWFAAYFCIVNSIIEEFFWRGYLGSDRTRLDYTDILFGGYHALVLLAFASPIWTTPVFVACAFAGWLWRMLRRMTGSLALPVITHIIADAGIIIAVHMRLFM